MIIYIYRYLHNFEDFYRKLGCTMVSNPRGSRTRHRSGRSLIRDCDKTPRDIKGRKDDSSESNGEETDRKDDEEGVTEIRKKDNDGDDARESERIDGKIGYIVIFLF